MQALQGFLNQYITYVENPKLLTKTKEYLKSFWTRRHSVLGEKKSLSFGRNIIRTRKNPLAVSWFYPQVPSVNKRSLYHVAIKPRL